LGEIFRQQLVFFPDLSPGVVPGGVINFKTEQRHRQQCDQRKTEQQQWIYGKSAIVGHYC